MNKDYLFKLYLAMRSEHVEWISRQSEHFSHYLTLVVAILGLTTAAVYHLYESKESGLVVVAAALLGFGVNVGLCYVAIRACDRFYKRFLEAITVMAKLEASLDLDVLPSGSADEKAKQGPFANDEGRLFPARYEQHRKCHDKEATFVQALKGKGVNLWVRVTMGMLGIANILLLSYTIVLVCAGYLARVAPPA